MVQVEFLKFPNQVNKGVNLHLNLPGKKIQTFAQIIWCVSKRDRNVLFFWCCWKERLLMTNQILCQMELRDWLSYRGQQKTLVSYHDKCHGRFLCSFKSIHGYLTREIYLGKVGSQTLTEFPAVKVSHVTPPIKLTPGLCKMYIAPLSDSF